MPEQVVLNKVTLTYSSTEDRMQMTGEVSQSDPLVFWLTRRMCEQLVVAVSDFIEKASPIPTGADKDLMQSFRQNAALIRKEKSPPVVVGSNAKAVLVHKIDLTFQKETVLLAFYMSDAESAQLPLSIQTARQWLGILYVQYLNAEWPLDKWPSWATESPDKPASADRRQLMH
jgi:hypothetical protein